MKSIFRQSLQRRMSNGCGLNRLNPRWAAMVQKELGEGKEPSELIWQTDEVCFYNNNNPF